MMGTELVWELLVQILLASQLTMLGWMFKGRVLSTHDIVDAMWSKWVTLITEWAQIGNLSCPGVLDFIMDWPEGKKFGILLEEELTS